MNKWRNKYPFMSEFQGVAQLFTFIVRDSAEKRQNPMKDLMSLYISKGVLCRAKKVKKIMTIKNF